MHSFCLHLQDATAIRKKNGDFSFHDNSAQSTQNQNETEQNNSGQDDVDQSAADSKQEEASKTLIAYFSRAGNTDFPAGVDAVASASLIVKDGELYGGFSGTSIQNHNLLTHIPLNLIS